MSTTFCVKQVLRKVISLLCASFKLVMKLDKCDKKLHAVQKVLTRINCTRFSGMCCS
jgi:hypothetical protein